MSDYNMKLIGPDDLEKQDSINPASAERARSAAATRGRTMMHDNKGLPAASAGYVRGLEIVPINLNEAKAYVAKFHRHHKPPVGHKFSLAVADPTGTVRGVAIIGRPVARHLDNGWTLEVTRCCTDGVRNGCSILYGAAWRVTKAMGYKRLITYTLPNEGGASLRGAGWKCLGERGGGNWNKKSRPRLDTTKELQGQKWLWEIA